MPESTGNQMLCSIQSMTAADGSETKCLRLSPPQLRILQAQGQTIVLVGDKNNTRNVIFTFDSASRDLFAPPPGASEPLPAGGTITLHLKADLGIHHRDTHFADQDPQFARTITFVTDPAQRCGSGDASDVVVET